MQPTILPRSVETMAPADLRPDGRNARTHSRKQIREIARSIERFGFTNPVLVDDRGQIIAGHGRVAAAKLLGLADVPILRLSHLSPAEQRAYVIADNRLAEKAGWDREILAIELGLVDLDFEVELTGFETGEIDLILVDGADGRGDATAAEDRIPDPTATRPVSRAGGPLGAGHPPPSLRRRA